MKRQELEKNKEYKYGFITDIESVRAPKGLNEEVIRFISKIKTVKCRKESKKGCNGKSVKCITHNLWDDLENHINKFFEDNTLNDILFKEVRNNSKELKR